MKKIKTKGPFITKTNRVIAREAGEIIRMPDEDYEEVKDLVELLEEEKPHKGLGISVNETIQTVEHGPGSGKKK